MRKQVGHWIAGLMPARRVSGESPRRRIARAAAAAVEPLEGRQLLSATINVNYDTKAITTGMAAAFDAIVQQYQHVLKDNVTINIDFERVVLPDGQPFEVISEKFALNYDTVRNLLIADAAADESVVALLPDSSEISYVTPDGFSVGNKIVATRANLLALGVDPGDLDSAPSALNPSVTDIDFTIRFHGGLLWDLNRDNGISQGSIDFYASGVHALFEGLGFISTVNTVNNSTGGTVNPTTLDLFRVAPGDVAANGFTDAARILSPGTASVFYDGGVFDPASISLSGYNLGEIPMSTGTGTGGGRDGNVANSWKDNLITGKYLGVMDPTVATPSMVNTFSTDIRALGLIGWDINPQTPTLTPAGDLTVVGTTGNDNITVGFANAVTVDVNGVLSKFIHSGVKTVYVYAGDGNDTVNASGNIKKTVVYGGAGNDTITGGSSTDTLYGEGGDDVLRGGAGADVLSGGDGFDTVTYSEKTAGINVSFDGVANDGQSGEGDNVFSDIEVLIGTNYNDTLNATAKTSGVIIFAGAGNDTIRGSAYSDELYGENGNDTIYANDGGYDIVDGGAGVNSGAVDLLLDDWTLLDTLL